MKNIINAIKRWLGIKRYFFVSYMSDTGVGNSYVESTHYFNMENHVDHLKEKYPSQSDFIIMNIIEISKEDMDYLKYRKETKDEGIWVKN